jgi:hypothetical protein
MLRIVHAGILADHALRGTNGRTQALTHVILKLGSSLGPRLGSPLRRGFFRLRMSISARAVRLLWCRDHQSIASPSHIRWNWLLPGLRRRLEHHRQRHRASVAESSVALPPLWQWECAYARRSFFPDGQSIADPIDCPHCPGRAYVIHRSRDPARLKTHEMQTFQCVACGHHLKKSVAR